MEISEEIICKIKETIKGYKMIASGDRVIVALSGGPDSVCLLDVLQMLSRELEITLVVAHYNHGLRGDEDKFETLFTRKIADSMQLPFETENASGLLECLSSIEKRSREARYAFLEKIRNKHGAQRIAMGHNLNDQAETVLMRLLRGSGPSGLAGIPPVRDNIIIRPLIEVTRDEITNYLNARRLTFAVDSSNSSRIYLRNRIRLELVPMMLDYQPRLLKHLGIVSDIIRDEDTFLESMALRWTEQEASTNSHGETTIPISSIKSLPDPLKKRAIRRLCRQVDGSIYNMEYDHVLSVIKLLDNEKPQCSIDLPNGIVVRKTYQNLCFIFKQKIATTEYSYSVKDIGTYNLGAIGCTLTLEEIDGITDLETKGDLSVAHLDADKLRHSMIIRNFRPGDRFVPLGMKGHKKVKNFFIDLKVPSEKRALTPILTCNGKIAWICGYRIDERFKVTERTKKIFRFTISQC